MRVTFHPSPVPGLSFFSRPIYIGAEPGQSKKDSRKTSMRMRRTPPSFKLSDF